MTRRHEGIPDLALAQAGAPDDLLSVADTAKVLGKSTKTLRNWRAQDKGPPSFRLLGRVRYRRGELAAWLKDQESQSRRAS